MVCRLRMADVFGRERRHVALDTARILRMMLLCEAASVTGNTFRTIVLDLLRRIRRIVRIMTGGARHFVAGSALAAALRQRFELAHGASALLVRDHKVANKIQEIVAGPELVSMAMRALDRDIAFEMALHANCVATIRRELRKLQHGLAIGKMRGG